MRSTDFASTALTVNGKSVDVGSGNAAYAIIDSGTTLIGGPADVIKEFYSNIPGSMPFTDTSDPDGPGGLYAFRALHI